MKSPKVLIVDDSKTICLMLKRQLEGIEAETEFAFNGQAGLERAVSGAYDLIISDIEMPKMNGFELCRKLKEHPATKSVPVIIMSVSDNDEDIARGFNIGASAYIVKSMISRDLLPRVNDVFKRAKLLRDRLFLVVDDSKLICNTLQENLIRAGFRVVCAHNGKEGLDLLDSCAPDIILSDINMPVMDGAAFCEAVRAREDYVNVPFVTMSTESDRRVMREMVQRGASAYLTKPFNIDQLIILAEKLLSDHVQLLVKEKLHLIAERNALLASISSLIQALEARDSYTRGHSEAVGDISIGMGRAMGIESRELERLGLAARLHDIGKIGIRDEVLLKPGKLTDEEFAIIKRHPVIGADILSPISSMSDLIPAILHHHERIDGRGYPHGLKGDSIHLFARIIAVADVYHALTSERPYRAPLSRDKAYEIIRRDAGDHLCPNCVDAFMNHMRGACDFSRAGQPSCAAMPDALEGMATALAGASILVIGAKPSFSRWMVGVLAKAGTEKTLIVDDQAAAFKLLAKEPFDIVVADPLEGDAGAALMRNLRGIASARSIPLLIIVPEDARTGPKPDGADKLTDFLPRPFDAADLVGKCKGLLARILPQGSDGERDGERKQIIDAILARHDAFCRDVADRLSAVLSEAMPDLPETAKSQEILLSQLKRLHLEGVIKEIIRSIPDILQAGAEAPEAVKNMLRDPVQAFQRRKAAIVSRHVKTSTLAKSCAPSDIAAALDEALASSMERFEREVSVLLAHAAGVTDDAISTLMELEKAAPASVPLANAFGRALLEPLENYFSIDDVRMNSKASRSIFPRAVCAPVLEIIKTHFIGLETYNLINATIMESLANAYKKEKEFQVDELKLFFSDVKIRHYTTKYILFLLNKLISQEKKDTFLEKVDSRIKSTMPGQDVFFSRHHLKMLLSSWVFAVKENLSLLKSQETAIKIINKYMAYLQMLDVDVEQVMCQSKQPMPRVPVTKSKEAAETGVKAGILPSDQDLTP